MKPIRLPRAVRAALAGLSALVLTAAVALLVSTWWREVEEESADKERLLALQETAKTDASVQPKIKEERDRQHDAAMARRRIYDRAGLVALAGAVLLIGSLKGLRAAGGKARRHAEGAAVGARKPSALEAYAKPRRQAFGLRGKPLAGHPCSCGEKDGEAADLSFVEEVVAREGKGPEACIPVLQAIQSHYRFLPPAALRRVAELTEITPSQIAGVATFYGQFRHRPVGEHILRVCEGTACHVAGAVEVREELGRTLGLAPGSDTDPSRLFTLERVACVGSCSLAPVVMIDDKIYGHVSPLGADDLIQEFLETRERRPRRNGSRRNGAGGPNGMGGRLPAAGPVLEIRVGMGSCGVASGAQGVLEAIEAEVRAAGGGAAVKAVGCCGLCHREPLVEVVEGGVRRGLYGRVGAREAAGIVRRHLRPRTVLGRLRGGAVAVRRRLFDDAAWARAGEREFDPGPYLADQVRIVLENCGEIDPLSLEEYRARDGFRALEECLRSLSPDEVVARVKASGLRGRGGAGFSTGTKWEIARRQPETTRYLIANGDEGDPGAFMDRAVMEADPFRVIEGLAIAAYAVGAARAFVYVRREYPIAVRHVRAAIARAEAAGLIGEKVLGTGFDLRIEVREGAGAFVCGEETALIRSIEGFRGMPRLRPPFPAQQGLWGKPTVINNVETLACLPWILRRGPEAFAALGTEKSKGTKVFSLAGKVNRGGLIEVPMGITIRRIVEEIGGGVPGGRKFKAVLLGGPSGGCIPESLADTRVDYDELTRTGAIMGSGGLVVLDDRDCAVDIARYFLHFTQSESCGKCTFCRVGTKRMLEILERICAGKGRAGDLKTLEELADRVKRGSLCGLGQTAPNPVLTTLRYFRDEYEAHLAGRCPAARCKALILYTVKETCTGCTLCAQACPAAAIDLRPYERHEVIQDRCTKCGMCLAACPEDSIEVA